MKLLRNVAALALSAALLAGSALAITPEEAFPDQYTYPGFIDVDPDAWYAEAAKVCAQAGLMQGTSHAFSPDQILTVGEVATIAARMNEAITGQAIPMADPKPGEALPWYVSYVTYLEKLGITVPDPTKQSTRQEFVKLLSGVIPQEMLTPINTITALPDTSDPDVLRFYNAGILTGVDSYGTFAPDKTLTRAECGAMVARIARTALRLTFTPAARSYALYVGQSGEFASFPAESSLDPAQDSAALVKDLLSQMSQLTGWNLDTADIYVGKGGVTICWAQDSALFAGPPEPQKEQFYLYDSIQLAFTVLDSVQYTVQCAFSPNNPEALDVWFCGPDGGPLVLDELGISLPIEEPYSNGLLQELLQQAG